jgi:hypothetical protein
MSTETAITKPNGKQLKPIPKFQDLISMEVVNSNENEFQILLNQEPPKEWIKTNDMANGSKYIPIDKIEYLLTRLFIKWWVQVIDYKVIANSVAAHIRLFYISPITGETLQQDGLGAAPMQTNKGASATDFSQIKNSAVQMSLPAAESYAIKDAAEKIGRLFGKDLNRKDLMAYENLSGRFVQLTPAEKESQRLSSLIENATTRDQLERIEKHITPELKSIFKSKMAELV